jgi:hypothetical protein
MRKIILFILPFLLIACHPRDPEFTSRIDVDESIISNIDSIQLISESGCNETQKVIENEPIYNFCGGNPVETFTLRIKLKNDTEIKSENIQLRYDDRVLINQKNGAYVFETDVNSRTFDLLKTIIIYLLVIFLSKVVVGLVLINPDSKIKFILKYGLYNLFLVLVTFLVIGATATPEIAHSGGLFFVGFGFLCVLLIDFYYLYKYSKKKSITRPILTVIIGNTLLIIIVTYLNNSFIL